MNCTRSGWYCDVNGDGQFLFMVHGCFHSGRDDVQLWFEPLWPMGVEFVFFCGLGFYSFLSLTNWKPISQVITPVTHF